jgi:hypothetical protein
MASVPQILANRWQKDPEPGLERTRVVSAKESPQGFEVERVRTTQAAVLSISAKIAVLVSVVRGTAVLERAGQKYRLESGVHLYLPFGTESRFELSPGSELVLVSTDNPAQARGKEMLIRDEMFLAACATEAQTLRWTLTPQYLSRRIFLHHDPILVSRTGDPVSWFHTTMFDVSGLPANEEGESVFKMSYNSRTELNVIYDVAGNARVRFALHPYSRTDQQWTPWQTIDSEMSYYLNEPAEDGKRERNKHEVFNSGGHVSLLCMFDPAPSGIERHRPGEYSDYEPLADVTARPEHAVYRAAIAEYDAMLDQLSLARAKGELDTLRESESWALYQRGRAAQIALEAILHEELTRSTPGRERVIRRWLSLKNSP